jgi:hypothetical protein
MFKIINRFSIITRKTKFSYHSFIGQPVDSIGINSIINTNIVK